MISVLISRIVMLTMGTLYPAYASYKAVKSKNVKEYVKWMMYWIVFALFTCGETFADIFISWFPFYYEIKIIFVLWLLSPATKGSSILYRRFVHPHFAKREQEIDSYIDQVGEQGYYAVVSLGSKGLSYAATMVVQGQAKIVEQIKNYSLNDLLGGSDSAPAGEVKVNPQDVPDGMDDELSEREFVRRHASKEMYGGEGRGTLKRSGSATRVTKKHREQEADLEDFEELGDNVNVLEKFEDEDVIKRKD